MSKAFRTWTLEDDIFLIENFGKMPINQLINILQRTETAVKIRYNILHEPSHYACQRLQNKEAIVPSYTCKCSQGISFDKKTYEAHLNKKSHVLFMQKEEIKELRIQLETKSRKITELNCTVSELENKLVIKNTTLQKIKNLIC